MTNGKRDGFKNNGSIVIFNVMVSEEKVVTNSASQFMFFFVNSKSNSP